MFLEYILKAFALFFKAIDMACIALFLSNMSAAVAYSNFPSLNVI